MRDAKPSRTERLQDAAEDARADKQASAESDNHATEARQEAEPQSIASEDGSAQERGRVEEKAHEESNDHEFQQQQYTDPAAVAECLRRLSPQLAPQPEFLQEGQALPGCLPELLVSCPMVRFPCRRQRGAGRLRLVSGPDGEYGPRAGDFDHAAGCRRRYDRYFRRRQSQIRGRHGGTVQAWRHSLPISRRYLGRPAVARQTGQLLRPAATPADPNADAAKQPIDIDMPPALVTSLVRCAPRWCIRTS